MLGQIRHDSSSMYLAYWFMFPVAVAVSTIALSFGIGGAVFFSPIFILIFPLVKVETLEPADAFGAALMTELVGFGSGLVAYSYRKWVDWHTGVILCITSIPMSIAGTCLKREIPSSPLLMVYAVGMLLLAVYVLVQKYRHPIGYPPLEETLSVEINGVVNYEHLDESLKTGKGATFYFKFCNWIKRNRLVTDRFRSNYIISFFRPIQAIVMAMVGAFATGLISVGIGETIVPTLASQRKIPIKIVKGTSVFVVTVVIIASNATDLIYKYVKHELSVSFPWTLLMWTMPGVLLGSQIGAYLAGKIPEGVTEVSLISLFLSIFLIVGTTSLLILLHVIKI